MADTAFSFEDAQPSSGGFTFEDAQPKKQQSAIGYLASQAKAGITADLPTIAGKALQYAGATDIGGRMRAYGESNAAQAQPDENQGAVTKMAATAIRGAAPIVPLAVGGLAANVFAPEVAVPLELAGAAGLAGGFGGAQAQDTLEKAKAAGLSDEDATSAARKTGLITSVGMGAVGALTGGIAAPAIRALAGTGAKTAADVIASEAAPALARPFLADTAGHLAGNVASMAASNAGVAKVEQDAGLGGPTPGQAALEGVESGAGLTAALLPFGLARTALARRANTAAVNRLQNPDTPPEQRAAIADQIHERLKAIDPEAAGHFADSVTAAINGKQPLELGEHILGPQEAAPAPAQPLGKSITGTQPANLLQSDPLDNAALLAGARQGPDAPTAPELQGSLTGTKTADMLGMPVGPDGQPLTGEAKFPAPTRSEAMGLDPNAGPISRAAVLAVDSGAHDHVVAQAAQAAAEEAAAKAPKGKTNEATKAPEPTAAPAVEQVAAAPRQAGGEPAGGAAVAQAGNDRTSKSTAPVAPALKPIESSVKPTDILNTDGAPFRNRVAAGAALKKAGPGHEVSPLAEGGFVVRPLEKEAGPPTEPKALHMGITPGSAEPVTVKDGIVHVGKYPALDYNSGEPVKVKAGASDAEVKQALKEAGSMGRREKFFGGEADVPDNKMAIGRPEVPVTPQFGIDGMALHEGGKPFANRIAAGAFQKEHNPSGRVVKVKGGFAIRDSSEKEDAARQAAGKRLQATLRANAYEANPLKAFIAKHGLAPELASEFAPGLRERQAANVRGFESTFRKGGLQMDKLAEIAAQDGFLPPGDHDANRLYDMVARAMRGERIIPLYAEAAAEKEMQKHIDEHRELDDLMPNDLDHEGYDRASVDLQARVREIMAGVPDAVRESVLEDVAKRTENATDDEYIAAVRKALEAAVPSAGEAGAQDRARADGKAGAEPAQQGKAEGLTPAADKTAQGLSDFFGRVLKRHVMEARGQDILDGMDERGESPGDVADKFWTDTYFKLPANVQERFKRMAANHGGDNILTEKAKPREVLDMPSKVEMLEGTERGFVSLMKEANDRFAEPDKPALTAPTKSEVVAAEARKESAPALDAKAAIDREAKDQTLTQPVAPEQRKDTSGDMFAREKAQAEVDKKNQGKPKDDGGTVPMFSRSKIDELAAKQDAEYLAAVKAGDMETAQRIVDVAAVRAGYATPEEYRMSHRAPNREDASLVTVKSAGLVPADYWTHPHWYQGTPEEREAFYAVTDALRRDEARVEKGRKAGGAGVMLYRAVPKAVKEDSFRNGDWVTPSLAYAQSEGAQISGGYRIIKMSASLRNVWWDGNSIAELGYDNGQQYAYKNTKNNRKLVDAVTRDDAGEIIPPSKRFNARNSDARFRQDTTEGAPLRVSEIRKAIAPALDSLKVPYELHSSIGEARDSSGLSDIPGGVKGMYYGGKLHLVAEGIKSPLEAEETLWHEVNHAGIDRIYGSSKSTEGYYNAMRGLAMQNANIREGAKDWMREFGKDDTAARIAAGMDPEKALMRTKMQAVEEALSNLAGKNAKINGAVRFIAKVQEFMRAVGLNRLADSLEKMTDAQALAMIFKAREAVTKEPQTQRAPQLAPSFSEDHASSSADLKARVLDAAFSEPTSKKNLVRIDGDGMLAGKYVTKKSTVGVFVTKEVFGRQQYIEARKEALKAGLDPEKMYVYAKLGSYLPNGVSFTKLEDVLTEDKGGASFSRTLDKISDRIDAIKGAAVAKDVGTAYDGVLMATNPAARSDAAKEMARTLIAGMGEKEMKSIQFRVKLNAAIQETAKATTLSGKARDLMEKGLTIQADKVFLRNTPEENHAFMQAMDTGDEKYFTAHPELKPMADVIARMFDEKAKEIQGLGTGALQAIRENYFPHIWNREPSGDAQREIFTTLAKRPLEGRKGFTKERVFDDVRAGLDAGFEPVSNNPLDLVALKMEEMDKYILAHKTLNAMEGSNGVHLIAAGEKTPQGFTDVNGRFGSIERNGEKLRYVARDDVAQVINNYLSPSLYHNKYVGKPFTAYMGAANTLNQFQLGVFSAFHAGFTSMEAVISHAAIGVKSLTAGDFKGAAHYLGTAPAAWINNPKMGSKIIAHMMDSSVHPEMAPILEGLQLAGFKWQMDNRFRTDATKNMLQAWQDGKKFKAGLNSIGALAEQTARPILEWLVPRQKFGVFGEMYSKWMQDNPNATHEELRNSAQQIWNRVDSRLGQVVYDRLFVHNVSKNFAQMLIRAPGWTGGTILEVGGGIKDLAGYMKALASGKKPESISDRAAYTLSMLMVTAMANAAMTAMFTGSAPNDWKDLVAFRTGNMDEHGRPERFMLPTYMKDVYAYAKAPGTTLVNKAHPLLSLIGDIGKNKDFYGTEIRSEDANLLTQLAQTAGFAAKAFVPFWMKGVQKEQEREGSALAMAAPLVGVMPAPSDLNKSDAEKLMTQYGADKMPQGSRTQEETQKADLRRQMLQALRKGEQDKAKALFDQGKEQGLFGPRDYLKVIRQARQDPLVSQFNHLTFDQAQRVMKVATDAEKQELAPLFMRKRIADQRQHGAVEAQ